MVLFGIFYRSASRKMIPALSLTIHLVMGWTIVFSCLFVRQASTPLLLALIAAGGVLYTLGVVLRLAGIPATTTWSGTC